MFWSFVVSGAAVVAVGAAPDVVSVGSVVAVVVLSSSLVGVQNGDKAQKRLVVKIKFGKISCDKVNYLSE